MEVEKVTSISSNSNKNNNTHVKEENMNNNNNNKKKKEEDDEGTLPGFRFHPTDEELVGFYLKRKVEQKPIRIELIKQIDIYKYDPWDLPKVSNVGDKEWYFFCIRGRKYRNSIRPNRVTGSGFWKATGIDKPIYSVKEPHDCIGLKKSLVYYRGSAGKGTKTDWMMHEFRLPPNGKTAAAANFPNAKENLNAPQEAEVWTLCRIFKRIPSYKKDIPANDNQNWKESTTPKKSSSISSIISCPVDDSCSKTCSLETDHNDPTHPVSLELDHSDHHQHRPDQKAQISQRKRKKSSLKPAVSNSDQQSDHDQTSRGSWIHVGQFYNNNLNIPLNAHQQYLHHHQGSIFPASYPSLHMNPITADQDLFMNGSWDELRPVVQLAVDRHPSQRYDVTHKA